MKKDEKIPVKFLLTHENPDIDAITSVLLMRRFGEENFPGAGSAPVIFCSADHLPENKTPDKLEQEGILAVDVGGGRFDTHPIGNKTSAAKKDRCATDIVASALGIIDLPEWASFVEFVRLQDTEGHSLFSREPIHNFASLTSIFQGIDILFRNDSEKKMQLGIRIIENIPSYALYKIESAGAHNTVSMNEEEVIKHLLSVYITNRKIDFLDETKHASLANWQEKLNSDFQAAFSNQNFDNLITIVAIIGGAYYKSGGDFEFTYPIFELCLDAILAKEEKWLEAVDEFKSKAIVKIIGKVHVASIESDNGMVIKVARHLSHGDIIIFRSIDDGGTTIFIKRNGILHNFPFKKIVSKIRLVESYLNNEKPLYDKIGAVGEVHGWFLHQSDKLLIKGSPKAKNFVPSKISIKLLNEIVYYVFDPENDHDIPLEYLKLFLANDNPIFRKK